MTGNPKNGKIFERALEMSFKLTDYREHKISLTVLLTGFILGIKGFSEDFLSMSHRLPEECKSCQKSKDRGL
jgi:hypothetical protein